MDRTLNWVEFTQPDARVLVFSPDGLLTQGRMYPEASADFLQRLSHRAALSDGVPQQVKDYFNGARQAFVRGFFSYELFAVSAAIGALAEEFALGERFVDFFENRFTLVRKTGETTAVSVERFGLLVEMMRTTGPHQKKDWRIQEAPGFAPMLGWLVGWARGHGLLNVWLNHRWERAEHGTRSMVMTNQLPEFTPAGWNDLNQGERDEWFDRNARTRWEDGQIATIRELRNALAHPTYAMLQDPITAANLLRANAEFISSLWAREPSS